MLTSIYQLRRNVPFTLWEKKHDLRERQNQISHRFGKFSRDRRPYASRIVNGEFAAYRPADETLAALPQSNKGDKILHTAVRSLAEQFDASEWVFLTLDGAAFTRRGPPVMEAEGMEFLMVRTAPHYVRTAGRDAVFGSGEPHFLQDDHPCHPALAQLAGSVMTDRLDERTEWLASLREDFLTCRLPVEAYAFRADGDWLAPLTQDGERVSVPLAYAEDWCGRGWSMDVRFAYTRFLMGFIRDVLS